MCNWEFHHSSACRAASLNNTDSTDLNHFSTANQTYFWGPGTVWVCSVWRHLLKLLLAVAVVTVRVQNRSIVEDAHPETLELNAALENYLCWSIAAGALCDCVPMSTQKPKPLTLIFLHKKGENRTLFGWYPLAFAARVCTYAGSKVTSSIQGLAFYKNVVTVHGGALSFLS